MKLDSTIVLPRFNVQLCYYSYSRNITKTLQKDIHREKRIYREHRKRGKREDSAKIKFVYLSHPNLFNLKEQYRAITTSRREFPHWLQISPCNLLCNYVSFTITLPRKRIISLCAFLL